MARNNEEMKKEVVDQLYWDVKLDASDIEDRKSTRLNSSHYS